MRRKTRFSRLSTRAGRAELFSLAAFRRRLAEVDALPQLTLLGLFAGLTTGVVMVAFRFAVEAPAGLVAAPPDVSPFALLPPWLCFALPTLGGLLLGVAYLRVPVEHTGVGVTHVMERLARHQGHIPVRNAVVQFLGGFVALASGQSGGREGPAIHLGAAASSLLGQRLRLPNNSIRTLVGCGAAAAIAASFNTPIAGVVFAMEVVMMEYTVASFLPVILASVSATLVSVAVFGRDLAFDVPLFAPQSLWEMPFIALGGVLHGLVAVAFMALVHRFARFSDRPSWQRFGAAGALAGCAALFAPQVLGVGYETVNGALAGEIALLVLVALAVLKLLVSAAATGLGMPVGFIGPVLVIGALVGGVLGELGLRIWPMEASEPGFHALIGMAAMMGAVLQAPLAAMLTVLELTGDPTMLLPAMLAIVLANLTCSRFYGARSLIVTLLEARGLSVDADPLTQALQRAGVASRMERNIIRLRRRLTADEARAALERAPRWLVVDNGSEPACLLAPADLRRHLDSLAAEADPTDAPAPADLEADGEEDENPTELLVDLIAIPGLRKDVVLLQFQATLHEAMTRLKETGREAVCVTRTAAPMIAPVIGVITREDIEKYYGFGD